MVRRFASELLELQASAGSPSFRELEQLAKLRSNALPRSTAAEAVAGNRLPSMRTTIAFVDACIAHAEALSIPLDEDARDLSRWVQNAISTRRLVRQTPLQKITATSGFDPIIAPPGGVSRPSNGEPTSPNIATADRALESGTLPDKAKSWAVLMGTAHYTNDDLPDLPAVTANMKALRERLSHSENGGFDASQCITLADATDLVTVGRTVQEAADSAADILLFYYSGHAFSGEGGGLYLGLTGSGYGSHYFTALSFQHLAKELAYSQAKRIVIILDCSFAGRAIHLLPIDYRGYVLCAAGRNRAALSMAGEEFTAFTGALLSALDGGTASGEPQDPLSLDWVYTELARQLEVAGRPMPEQLRTGHAGRLALTSRSRTRRASPSVDRQTDV
jgi:hypothetical protein